jgi:hypothetical protein
MEEFAPTDGRTPSGLAGRARRRANLTDQEIWAAADRLLRRGERVAIEAVRVELKGGAPYTIQMALRAWWQELPRRLKGGEPEPAAARAAFEAFWQTARAEALTRVRAEAQREDADRAQSLARAMATADTLRAELEQARAARAQLEQERNAALEQAEDAERRTAVLRLQLDNAKGLLELERRRHPEPGAPGAVLDQLAQLQAQCAVLIDSLSARPPEPGAPSAE